MVLCTDNGPGAFIVIFQQRLLIGETEYLEDLNAFKFWWINLGKHKLKMCLSIHFAFSNIYFYIQGQGWLGWLRKAIVILLFYVLTFLILEKCFVRLLDLK